MDDLRKSGSVMTGWILVASVAHSPSKETFTWCKLLRWVTVGGGGFFQDRDGLGLLGVSMISAELGRMEQEMAKKNGKSGNKSFTAEHHPKSWRRSEWDLPVFRLKMNKSSAWLGDGII